MTSHFLYGPLDPQGHWVPAPRYTLRRLRILELLANSAPLTILDVGCGAGAMLQDLSDRRHRCSGLEPSPAARALALRMTNGEIPILPEPARGWGGRFDLVMACEVLEHIEDDCAALRQWTSWLRPGGRLLLSVPARRARWTTEDEWAGHFRRYEWSELRALLVAAGLRVERFECYGFPLANLTEGLRARALGRRRGGESMRAATAASGVDRVIEARWFFLQTSWPGVAVMRFGNFLQRMFLSRDLGGGYLALARKET